MRHRQSRGTLNRSTSYRRATLRDIARAVVISERIITTKVKAKAARRLVERLITLGKQDTLAARRTAFKHLCDHRLVSLLFSEIAPRFQKRSGGYTRLITISNRRGDNAERVILELTEMREVEKSKKKKGATQAKEKIPKAVSDEKQKPVEKKKEALKPSPEAQDVVAPKEKKKEEKKAKDEQQQIEEPDKKKEQKPPKKFFSGLRKFIKKDRNSK
ncbi:50S ribosomal protein L17 [Candidatus Omnitrophota bacterium]